MDAMNKFVFIQKTGLQVPASGAYSQIYDPNTTATYIQDGQIVITDPEGHVYNTLAYNASTNPYGLGNATTPKKFCIRCRQGDTVYHSAEITTADVQSYIAQAYRPSLEQVTFVGYNGTDGTLASAALLTANTTYKLTLWREDNDAYMGVDRPQSAMWKSPATVVAATAQLNLGIELLDQLYKIFIKGVTGYRVFQPPMKVELICDDAGTGAATAAVYNEFEWITITDASGLTVNQVIRVGTGLYKILEIDSLKIKLHIPYQGATAAAAAIKTFTFADTFKFGIRIEGKFLTPEPSLWPFRKVMFKVSYNEYIDGVIRNYSVHPTLYVDEMAYKGGTTTNVAANVLISGVKSHKGVGTSGEVKWLEWNYMGAHSREKGQLISVDRERYRKFVTDANGDATTYSLVNINFVNKFTDNPTATVNDTGSITIAVPVTYVSDNPVSFTELIATAANAGFVTVLDQILVTLAGKFTAQAAKVKAY